MVDLGVGDTLRVYCLPVLLEGLGVIVRKELTAASVLVGTFLVTCVTGGTASLLVWLIVANVLARNNVPEFSDGLIVVLGIINLSVVVLVSARLLRKRVATAQLSLSLEPVQPLPSSIPQDVQGGEGTDKEKPERTLDEDDLYVEPHVWQRHMTKAGLRVCLVEVNGQPQGTGFLVADDLVVTCYHVVESVIAGKEPSGSLRLRFYFALQPRADDVVIRSPGVVRRVAKNWLAFQSPKPKGNAYQLRSSDELDLAVLRLEPTVGEHTARGTFPVCPNANEGAFGRGVVILQHPFGSPIKLTQDPKSRARVIEPVALNIAYGVSTEAGASGAPVLNYEFQLIGIHQAAGPGRALYNLGLRADVLARVLRDVIGH